MQTEITTPGPLLKDNGRLAQVGWMRQPLLDPNLERARFYPIRALQFLRFKRWDYYAVFTPWHFFSATIADLGYAGNIFVYILDMHSGDLHEEGLVVPLSRGVQLPRTSVEGTSSYKGQGVELSFRANGTRRELSVDWPAYHAGRGIKAEIELRHPADHESMTIVIPIGERRFYYNHKVNCLPAEGYLLYGDIHEELHPSDSLASLDWGRGVWEYRSFWNWASASGFLPDGRTVGLNLGAGFGDTSAATENCLVLDGKIHKLGKMTFDYDPGDYEKTWRFCDEQGRLDLDFKPFKGRLARTNLGIIFSEVHQMFGRYWGEVQADSGERVHLKGLIGFAEEHRARW
jgi:Protein of unknown function (DUF2804)